MISCMFQDTPFLHEHAIEPADLGSDPMCNFGKEMQYNKGLLRAIKKIQIPMSPSQRITTSFGVSSKDLQKARRMAKRIRASVACARCKSAKSKCSDFRPCKHCSDLGGVCNEAINVQGKEVAKRQICNPSKVEIEVTTCQPNSSTERPTGRPTHFNRNEILSTPWSLPVPINTDVYQSIPSALRCWPPANQFNPTPSRFVSSQSPAFGWQQASLIPALPPAIAGLLMQNEPAAAAVSVPPPMALRPATALQLLIALSARPPTSGC